MKPLVVGVGNRWRGDDGIGPAVVDAIAARGRDDVDLTVVDGEPARLMADWAGRPAVVVVDAIRAGAPPGTILRLAADAVPTEGSGSSTHGAGVAAAVELARALGALPERLVVLGVEPELIDHGEWLSPAVAAAVAAVAERAVAEVTARCA